MVLVPGLLLAVSSHAQNNCDEEFLEYYKNEMFSHVKAVRTEKALNLADSLLPILENESFNICENYFWIKFYKGEAYELKADYEESMQEYQDILKSIPMKKWTCLQTETYLSLARLHEAIGRPEDCLRYLKKGLEIIEISGNQGLYSRYCIRYSSYHRIYESRDSAITYATKALVLGKATETGRSIIDGHLLLGILQESLDSALHHFDMVTKLYLQRENYYGAISQILNIAVLLLDTGFDNRAKNQIEKALFYEDSLHQYYPKEYALVADIHRLNSRYFKNKQKYDSALFYLEKSQSLKNKYDQQIKQEVINQKELDFAIQSEKKKGEFLTKRAKTLQGALIVFLILLFFLVVMLIRNNQKNQKIKGQNELITEQNEQLTQSFQKQSTLLSEVHHRVKNNLQLIISILTLQSSKIDDKMLRYEIDHISEKIRSIALIHEQLYQTTEFEKVEIKVYIKNLLNHYYSLKQNGEEFNYTLQCADLYFNLETIIPFGMIFTELINNSLKYGKNVHRNLHLDISLVEKNNAFHFIFQDNGTGYPSLDLEKLSSMGATLIRSMARQLKAEYQFFNHDGAGFKLIFKEKITSSV